MNYAAITGMDCELPRKIISNEELMQRFPNGNMESFLKVIGIQQRHACEEGETAGDLGFLAADRLLTRMGIDRSSIDGLTFATLSPDYISPTTSSVLQHRLGLGKNVCTFDIMQACPGFVHHMATVNGLISTGACKRILAINADTPSKLIHPKDGALLPIHGDGAVAMIVERQELSTPFFNWYTFGTDGSQRDRIIIPMGMARQPYDASKIVEEIDAAGNVRTNKETKMDGAAVFHFVIHVIPKFIKESMAQHNETIEDYDLILLHQANKMMVEMLYKMLKVPAEKQFAYMENVGNLGGTSIPMVLLQAIRAGRCKPGSRVLMCAFGAGLTWAATSLTVGEINV